MFTSLQSSLDYASLQLEEEKKRNTELEERIYELQQKCATHETVIHDYQFDLNTAKALFEEQKAKNSELQEKLSNSQHKFQVVKRLVHEDIWKTIEKVNSFFSFSLFSFLNVKKQIGMGNGGTQRNWEPLRPS